MPNRGFVDFESYQELLVALRGNREHLGNLKVQELNENGSVRATLNNDEVRQIVLEMDGIVLPTFQSEDPKDT